MQEAAEHRKTQKDINAEKTALVAKGMYPNENWEFVEEGIYIAKSRIPRNAEQINILDNELLQARVLVKHGSIVYLLPENAPPDERNIKYPDAVVDGIIMEFKIVLGNERKIKEKYKAGRKKAENVFLYIEPPFSHRTVTRKLLGTIRGKGYKTGSIWVYFSSIDKMVYWSVKDFL